MVFNKNWEDYFDENDYDDHKIASSEREYLRQLNSSINWIYIGLMTNEKGIAKVGLTTGKLGTRASSSQNPYYTLLCAFKVKDGVTSNKIHEIESATIKMLENEYSRIDHKSSDRPSEWFKADPSEMRGLVDDFLGRHYSPYMHCYHDSHEVVISTWVNNKYLHGNTKQSYYTRDLSNLSVNSQCLMPGGCGNCDCDFWD